MSSYTFTGPHATLGDVAVIRRHSLDKLADRFDINRAQVLTATGNLHSWYAHPPNSTFWRNFPTWNEAFAYAMKGL